jgi:hypothetical protein
MLEGRRSRAFRHRDRHAGAEHGCHARIRECDGERHLEHGGVFALSLRSRQGATGACLRDGRPVHERCQDDRARTRELERQQRPVR